MKNQRKAQQRLGIRIRAYEATQADPKILDSRKKSYRKPGSMNAHKSASIKELR